ncbi:MAG: DUF4328 domain-containing protein [Thermoleophilia bacterium]|nr:DUF4328 domain-containing protein [Thermoleophilia bacterium]
MSSVFQLSLFSRLVEGKYVSETELERADGIAALVGATEFFLYAVTAIAFIAWFYRSYRNLPSLGWIPRFSAKWTVLGFLIPVISLISPTGSPPRSMPAAIRRERDSPAAPTGAGRFWLCRGGCLFCWPAYYGGRRQPVSSITSMKPASRKRKSSTFRPCAARSSGRKAELRETSSALPLPGWP